jgi:thioredoxin 2
MQKKLSTHCHAQSAGDGDGSNVCRRGDRQPLPVMLDCWAAWCAPCGAMAPVLDDLAKGYAGRLKVAKLNVDQNPVTASRYSVLSLPTLLFFRDGKVVDTAAGALPRQEIERYLWRFLAR